MAAPGRRVIRFKSRRPASAGPPYTLPPQLLRPFCDLARAANESCSRAQLAALVVQSACEAVAADTAALSLADEPGDQLRLICASEGAAANDPNLAPEESL